MWITTASKSTFRSQGHRLPVGEGKSTLGYSCNVIKDLIRPLNCKPASGCTPLVRGACMYDQCCWLFPQAVDFGLSFNHLVPMPVVVSFRYKVISLCWKNQARWWLWRLSSVYGRHFVPLSSLASSHELCIRGETRGNPAAPHIDRRLQGHSPKTTLRVVSRKGDELVKNDSIFLRQEPQILKAAPCGQWNQRQLA